MSIALELDGNGRKTGRVCDRDYRQGTCCPLIVRETSEDLLMSNVFSILRRLRPTTWLLTLLHEAYRGRRFPVTETRGATMTFWERFRPPAALREREHESEVDAVIRLRRTTIFVEAKYRSSLATRTTNDPSRDQLIRLLDVGYEATVARSGHDLLVLVIGVPEREPELLTRYRSAAEVERALARTGRGEGPPELPGYLSRTLGYLSWTRLANLLLAAIPKAQLVEQGFLADVIRYIRHRVALSDAGIRRRKTSLIESELAVSGEMP